MKNEKVLFRMAARCEAAGRPNNEDNYQIDADLSDDKWGFTADAQVELGKKGALLVVCDGMGGMNAGEVASAIAVETIKSRFAADQLTDNALHCLLKFAHLLHLLVEKVMRLSRNMARSIRTLPAWVLPLCWHGCLARKCISVGVAIVVAIAIIPKPDWFV